MIRARILSLALLIACLAPGLAWKGENSGRVQPIATVLAQAELGDIVAIEGSVANTTTGGGSRMVAVMKDASGEVMVVIPDSLIRKLDLRTGEASGGQHYRVIGRWDHGQMDMETWGIYAQQIERLGTP
jgi:hypothetical protein